MAHYQIINSDNEIINNILCDNEDWVRSEYPDCTFSILEPVVLPEPTAEQEARVWRNSELASTDQAAQVSDWPNRDNILLYRTALRDWPSTAEFPSGVKPTL